MAFQNGVPVLSSLDLTHNLLGKIPFMAISSMKSLKTLDLSNNRIENIEDSFSKIKLKLDNPAAAINQLDRSKMSNN